MCQIPLFRIKNSIAAFYFLKYNFLVRRKCCFSHLMLSCEPRSFPSPLSKHWTAAGKRGGDGKGRGNRSLVDAPRIQGDWSDTHGCFGLAAWAQQMLLWTLALFPGLGCHLVYLVRPLFFTSLCKTGQS